jgi:hypothetical protein
MGVKGATPLLSFNGKVKSPTTALRFILRHCGALQVHLMPQELRVFNLDFYQNMPECPVPWGGDEWHPLFPSPLVGEGKGEGEKEEEILGMPRGLPRGGSLCR